MNKELTLGDRIKQYEDAYETNIIKRIPIIIRADGKGFSKYTKYLKLQKPFDEGLCMAMAHTMLEVASNIEGCVFAYTQSDEMTFVVRNDQSNESEPWFGNRLQKINSVVASMITAHFNLKMNGCLAYFDSRVFAVPNIVEAENVVKWRQNDATKNSISNATYHEVGKVKGKGTARKLMHGLNQKQQQELLFKEAAINWDKYPVKYKRGMACYKVIKELDIDGEKVIRSPWILDDNIPVFTKSPDFLKDKLSIVNG